MDTFNYSLDNTSTFGCGCPGCQHGGTLANSEAQFQSSNDSLDAPSSEADPTTFANYLTTGFWEDIGGSERSWAQNNITFSLDGFTTSQQDGLRNAFDLWSDVADISFTEVSGVADISVSVGNDGRAYSASTTSGTTIVSNVISIDTSVYGWSNFDKAGDYALLTALHEIGHSLGLGHTGNYNGSATYANDAQWTNDSHQATVQSYFNASNIGSDHISLTGYQYPTSPMLIDIVAIQSIYGADYTTRSGNTIYGFNSNAGHDQYDFDLNEVPFAIWDGAGNDTIDASDFSTNQTIYLTEGNYSSTGNLTNNLVIAFGAKIENAIGGSGNDEIYGNDLDNIISGNAGSDIIYGSIGNDTIDGGNGSDTVNYFYSVTDFAYNFINNTTVALTNILDNFTDTLSNIENFIFSDGTFTFNGLQTSYGDLQTLGLRLYWENDGVYRHDSTETENITLTANDIGYSGSTGNQITYDRDNYDTTVTVLNTNAPKRLLLDGTSQSDVITINGVANTSKVDIYGGAGEDIINVNVGGLAHIYGGDGNDTITSQVLSNKLYGGEGDDVLTGGNGRDNLQGGNDNDTLNGGGNRDWLYGDGGNDIINGGDGNDIIRGGEGNDTLNGGDDFDRLYGDDGDDIIDGGNGNDRILGGNDNDQLSGGAGQDFLYGESGDDTLNGGESADTLFGGSGIDTLNGGNHNDRVYGGDDNDIINGDAGSDILNGENGNDTINGGNGNDVIQGGVGNDTINGDAHNDTIYGGNGNDIINGGLHNDSLNGEAGNDILNGDDGTDTLYGGDGEDILVGGAGVDTLFGGNDAQRDVFGFSASEDSEDRIYNFTYGIDQLNITDILNGYTHGVSDISEFVQVLHTGSRFDIRVDSDGGGDKFVQTARVFTDISDSLTANDLLNNNTLIANETLA